MAASVLCCLRCCRDGGTGHIPLKEMPAVQLDTQHMGTDVVIVKNGRRICGTGGCLASAPLHQNKSYFEFKIQSTGIWGIGVATQKVNLNHIPLGRDVHSLVMRNDGAMYHNNEEKNRLPANSLPQEGDVVGITYDHVELNVYLNGKNMHCPASGIRGTVYPVVYDDLAFHFIKKQAIKSEFHLPSFPLRKLYWIDFNLASLHPFSEEVVPFMFRKVNL